MLVDNLKERLGSLKFLAWLDNCAKPRSTRSNVGDVSDEDNEEITDFEKNLNFSQSDGESDKDLSPQSVAVTSTKIKSLSLKKKQKAEHKQNKRVKGRKTHQENIEDEELEILRSLSQEVKPKLTSRDNFTIFGEYIASKLHKLGGTLTVDEMGSSEFEITSVIEKARKFSQRKQSHYFNFQFVHSAGVTQQTHTYSGTGSGSANGPGSPQFNPPFLSNSSIVNTFYNTQVKNIWQYFIRVSMCCFSFLYTIAYDT